MKKKILFMLCFLMIVCFGACNKNTSGSTEQKNDEISKTNSTDLTLVKDDIRVKEDAASNIAEEDISAKEDEAGSLADKEVAAKEYFITESFESIAIASAMDNSRSTKDLKIYLPKSYYDSQKRYPVVYYFHGFGEALNFIIKYKSSFDELMTENKEFIVVEVSGMRASTSSSSFWVNSTVTGMWEDYVIDEIVPYIDEKYNTIPSAESRGIAGFSMGGFASINLGLKHPDIFSSVLAVAPGLLKEGSMDLAMKSWKGDNTFLRCYGQSFAPNIEKEELCDIPSMDGTPEDKVIIEKWEAGFGDMEEKISAYLEQKQRLKSICIMYGANDTYKWIPEGCIEFSRLLTEKEIDHERTELDTSHAILFKFADNYFVPFFSELLVFE